MDLHKEKVYGIVVDENGRIIKKGKFSNEKEEFHKFLQHVEEAIVAIESTGFTMPIYDFLEENGYTNLFFSHVCISPISRQK